MAKPYLSIIIPAYNEAKRLPATLVDIDRHLSQRNFSYEILAINDGSKDNTAEVVNNMAKSIRNLKLVDNKINQGKGGVVRQGMLLARGEYRLFMDADNSTAIDQFDKMIPYFSSKKYDVVFGSRAIKGAKLDPPQPFYRQIPGKVGNLFIQILLLPGIWDTQCGFKAFSEEVALKVFSLAKINGWGFDAEVLALAKKIGYHIKEVPVVWKNDLASRVGLSGYIRVLLEVVKIRFWFWFGKYDIKNTIKSM